MTGAFDDSISMIRGIFARGARGAAAQTASLMSIRHKSFFLRPLIPASTAKRSLPSELHPFIQ